MTESIKAKGEIGEARNTSEAGERTLGKTCNERHATDNEASRISKSLIRVAVKFCDAVGKVLSGQERGSTMARPRSYVWTLD